jgi:hypothetical protein
MERDCHHEVHVCVIICGAGIPNVLTNFWGESKIFETLNNEEP